MHEISESLNNLGYQGDCLHAATLEEAIANGLNSTVFRSLIGWIAAELTVLLNLDEQIRADGEMTEFCLELSSLLKEIACPYPALVSGTLANRYQSRDDRLLLLNYLISELMAAKMSHKLNPQKQVVIEILESPAAVALKSITQNLTLGKPPQNITPKAFFEKLFNRFTELSKKNEPTWGQALFTPSKQLTYEEWKKLEKLQKELDTEYDLRREMLLTRLDVTIQSFQWSDAIKNKGDMIVDRYSAKRKELDTLKYGGKETDLIELLAARDDLVYVEKTSSATVRKNTKTDLQKHIIGMVPDRGGRANEHQPPPPEMPAWQKNRSGGAPGGGRGGGRGGGNQGGFYKNQKPQQQRNFQQNHQQQIPPQHSGYSGPQGNNYHNQSGRGGTTRVQGGWSQTGGGRPSGAYAGQGGHQRNDGGNSFYNSGGGSNSQQQKSHGHGHQDGGYNRGGEGYRGQSNYSRGGRR